jgi:hypothetical protein
LIRYQLGLLLESEDAGSGRAQVLGRPFGGAAGRPLFECGGTYNSNARCGLVLMVAADDDFLLASEMAPKAAL